MAIEYKKNQAVFLEFVGAEEAEGLLEWLGKKTDPKLDLSLCLHLHPANLQVLMAAKIPVARWPNDGELRFWLESVLKGEE